MADLTRKIYHTWDALELARSLVQSELEGTSQYAKKMAIVEAGEAALRELVHEFDMRAALERVPDMALQARYEGALADGEAWRTRYEGVRTLVGEFFDAAKTTGVLLTGDEGE